MAELSWRHQTLIQALLSRGPLRDDQFHPIFNGLTGKNPGTHKQAFDEYLLKINKALSYVQCELRGFRNQYDGRVYYGVVNTVSDEQSKLGTKYSVPQIAFYKAIIEAIVQDATAQGSISNIQALNLRLENQVLTSTGSQSQCDPTKVPPAVKNFSLSQKEKTLDELVRDQWLNRTPDGIIGLGVRSFLDLRSYFRNNDIPSCQVCNEAGVKADVCQNDSCTVRIHKYCLKKFFSQRRGERVCPSCGTEWNYVVPKAELIDEEDEADVPTQTQPPRGPRTKRLRSSKTDSADVVGTGSSQASRPTSDLRRTTRSTACSR
ncbi:uncharacterized protein LOC111984627 isoform X2 [Quercus suber]|uniref:uncharacterized protein LOC111984627 isoform X2 n=1 Tax=Quercus suber TaxID=58331 RepID=UPI000CE26D9C|nr:non-structural maintenance of chromosomes element 1 homolog [Quercus suber]POE86305.1 non-structural maintenance of chromosomes element 1 like [Quercus suber]